MRIFVILVALASLLPAFTHSAELSVPDGRRLHGPISPQCSKWAKDDSRTAEELKQNLFEYMTAQCKLLRSIRQTASG